MSEVNEGCCEEREPRPFWTPCRVLRFNKCVVTGKIIWPLTKCFYHTRPSPRKIGVPKYTREIEKTYLSREGYTYQKLKGQL